MLVDGLGGDFDLAFAAPVDGETPGLAEVLHRIGVPCLPIALSYENLARSTFDEVEAMRLLDESRPDLVVSCDGAELSSLLAVKTVARRRGVPYVVIINLLSEDVRERFASLLQESVAALEAAEDLIFVSDASRRRFERLLPGAVGRPHVVPNSASDVFFAPSELRQRRTLRASLGVAEGDLLCLTAARMEERKGQALVAAALGRLRRAGRLERIRWILAGRVEDWDRQKFEAAVAEAGVGDHVEILGERGDMPALLDASDLFILTSYAEGMPLCVVEALAKGVPVVATGIDGVVEQLDQSCGILLPPPAGNEAACIDACADALHRLQTDHVLLARLGAGARMRAETLFHPSIGVARYRDLLTQVRARAGGGAPPVEPDFSIRPGTSLDLGAPDVAWNYLGSGWGACETGGVWTDGPSSSLRFQLGAADIPLRLTFDITPFAKRRDRSTRVFVNGQPVATWRGGSRREVRSLVVDPRVFGQKIVVRLDNPGATRPCDIGADSDWRQLGLFVHRLEVAAATPTFREILGRRWRALVGAADGPGSAPA